MRADLPAIAPGPGRRKLSRHARQGLHAANLGIYSPILDIPVREDQGGHDFGESINAKIQRVKDRACGFRNCDRFRNAIYFHCGGDDLYLLTFALPTPLTEAQKAVQYIDRHNTTSSHRLPFDSPHESFLALGTAPPRQDILGRLLIQREPN